MPIYLYPANLIIDKKAVKAHYKGGMDTFRELYEKDIGRMKQEDNQLFSLTRMNCDEFDIGHLMENGLAFDEEKQHSNYFVLQQRYHGFFWQVDWLKDNRVFAWHVDSNEKEIAEVSRISNMTLSEVHEVRLKGRELFNTIRYKA
jgi:nucleoside 2-deoxyribosyltransferase